VGAKERREREKKTVGEEEWKRAFMTIAYKQ